MNTKPYLTTNLIELHVPDFVPVKEFYLKLGFNIIWEKLPGKEWGYLVLKKDRNILCYYGGNEAIYHQSYFHKFSHTTPRGYGVEIIIQDKNIKKLYEKVHKLFPDNIVQPLKERFNKMEFRLVDPFGYYLRISQTLNILYP